MHNVKLDDDVCQAFPSPAALARSKRFMEILTDEEDPGVHYEIVRFHADGSAGRTSDLSEGIYLPCARDESREALRPWLEALASSDSAEERAAGERALQFYLENREAWELD